MGITRSIKRFLQRKAPSNPYKEWLDERGREDNAASWADWETHIHETLDRLVKKGLVDYDEKTKCYSVRVVN